MIILLILMFLIGGAVGFNLKEVLKPADQQSISVEEKEESEEAEIEKEETKEIEEVVTYKQISFLDSKAIYTASEEIFKEGMTVARDSEKVLLNGFDFRFLESLGIGKDRLEKGLRQWCDLNGYQRVAGASFLPKMEINVMDECLTFELFLHYAKEGNGLIDPSRQYLRLRYFYIKDDFLIY